MIMCRLLPAPYPYHSSGRACYVIPNLLLPRQQQLQYGCATICLRTPHLILSASRKLPSTASSATCPAGDAVPRGSSTAIFTPRRCPASAIMRPSWPPPSTPTVLPSMAADVCPRTCPGTRKCVRSSKSDPRLVPPTPPHISYDTPEPPALSQAATTQQNDQPWETT